MHVQGPWIPARTSRGHATVAAHVRLLRGRDWLAADQGTNPTTLQPFSQYILCTRIPLNRFRRPRSTARSPSAAKTSRARPRPVKTPGLCSVSLIGASSVGPESANQLGCPWHVLEARTQIPLSSKARREALGFLLTMATLYMTLSTLGFAASALMELVLGNLFSDCPVAKACFLTCCVFVFPIEFFS